MHAHRLIGTYGARRPPSHSSALAVASQEITGTASLLAMVAQRIAEAGGGFVPWVAAGK